MTNNIVHIKDIHTVVGEVFICPTDTVYGLSCRVSDVEAVSRIQVLKYGAVLEDKRFILLIADVSDLATFGVMPTSPQKVILDKLWPGPVSVVFPVSNQAWKHLSNDGTLAFRIPAREDVRDLVRRIGPIVSTSANKTGKPPATTTGEAIAYFGSEVLQVIDGGTCDASPSTLIKFLR